jgi:hypothetical protein
VFESFMDSDSDLYVELGMGIVVQGYGIVSFKMDSGGTLRVTNVLWVPKLRRSVLSILEIEKNGYDVLFQDEQVMIMPRGYSSEKVVVFGLRERNLYRIKSQPM